MNNLSDNIKSLKFMKKNEDDAKPINTQQWQLNFTIPQNQYQQLMQNRTTNTKEILDIQQNQCRDKYENS